MQVKHIATKFLVVLLPLFLVSFIILSGISYFVARGQLLESVSENAELVRQMTAVKLTNDVERKADLLDGLSRSPVIAHGTREERINVLQALKAQMPSFAMVAFSTPEGQAYSDTGQDMDRSSRDYIKKVRETKQPFLHRRLSPALQVGSSVCSPILCWMAASWSASSTGRCSSTR